VLKLKSHFQLSRTLLRPLPFTRPLRSAHVRSVCQVSVTFPIERDAGTNRFLIIIRLPTGCQPANSNFCARPHRLATIHSVQTTTDSVVVSTECIVAKRCGDRRQTDASLSVAKRARTKYGRLKSTIFWYSNSVPRAVTLRCFVKFYWNYVVDWQSRPHSFFVSS